MEKYQKYEVVGQGSYGIVAKCKNKETGKFVAIKKILDAKDENVKKIALREIKILKDLKHKNLIILLEVIKQRQSIYLVFEYMEFNLLDILQKHCQGLDLNTCRNYLSQILGGLNFCHSNNIIHRDIKPENILVSTSGIVKLCDFGFARFLSAHGHFTEYVATRWYRAPELLVGTSTYGKEVDIWAVGCLLAEMITGEPLFPGESDIDQIFLIVQRLGPLPETLQALMLKNPIFNGMTFPVHVSYSMTKKFCTWDKHALNFLMLCLKLRPDHRPKCSELMQHFFLKQHAKKKINAASVYQRICRTARLENLQLKPVQLEKSPKVKISINNLTFDYKCVNRKNVPLILSKHCSGEKSQCSVAKLKKTTTQKSLNLILPQIKKVSPSWRKYPKAKCLNKNQNPIQILKKFL